MTELFAAVKRVLAIRKKSDGSLPFTCTVTQVNRFGAPIRGTWGSCFFIIFIMFPPCFSSSVEANCLIFSFSGRQTEQDRSTHGGG
jgi:hypothetical protein